MKFPARQWPESNCAAPGGSTKMRRAEPRSAPLATQPNLTGIPRAAYVVVGIVLMAWGFFGVEAGWWRALLPVVGAFVLTEGLIGYCVIRGAFGFGPRKS